MNNLIRYSENGRIESVVPSRVGILDEADGVDVLLTDEEVSIENHYISVDGIDASVELRPNIEGIGLDGNGNVIGLPVGSVLRVTGQAETGIPASYTEAAATGAPLQINAPAGKVSIRIEHWPHKPETLKIDIPRHSRATAMDGDSAEKAGSNFLHGGNLENEATQVVTLNPFESLSACQSHCKTQIDAAAGKARARYITTDPGQAETYAEKARDAQDFIKNEPNFTETELETMHPWVAAAAAARGMSLQNAAVLILGAAGQWRPLGIKIEKLRDTVKHQIGQAPDQITACRIMQEGVAGLEAV